MAQSRQQLVIHGAGGHGRVVADAAAAAGLNVLGFLDDGLPVGHSVLVWRVLGNFDWLRDLRLRDPNTRVAVAHGVGSNAVREHVTQLLRARDVPLITVVHPTAVVSAFAAIGAGSVVLATAVVNAGAQVGRGALINTGAIVEHDVIVGDFAHVASGAGLAGGARIETRAMLGSGAVVLPQRCIGARSIVGAGAVVTRDIPSDCIAVGVPARVTNRVQS